MFADSHRTTIDRFNTVQAAQKYALSQANTATHGREVRCIRRGLAAVVPGSHVLDLPCGAGRMLPPLLEMGFNVTEADTSRHMLEQARARLQRENLTPDRVHFEVADALDTGLPSKSFDAVVCNRLFHHLREPDVRRRCLCELARISRGPVIVSFFCSLALDAIFSRVLRLLSGRHLSDRIPISYRTFKKDVAAAGLTIERCMATRWGISQQWYLQLRPSD